MLKQVDRNANPPVCKIMDYHKEMYKKKESDKERAKSKVRFAIAESLSPGHFDLTVLIYILNI
jgi:translation initiation factor IF-3